MSTKVSRAPKAMRPLTRIDIVEKLDTVAQELGTASPETQRDEASDGQPQWISAAAQSLRR